MAEKIGSYPRPGTETRPAGSQATRGAKRTEATSQPGGAAADAEDAISLTDTATRLRSIEARIHELPEVDRGRVEEIRRQIEAGEFDIDSKLIAQRIVQLEQALA